MAYDEYADAELYWVLVIINDIRDMIWDLPVDDTVLQTIAKQMTEDSEGFLDLAVRPVYYSDNNEDALVMSVDLTRKGLSKGGEYEP